MARFRTLVVEDNFGIQETYQLVARMRGHERDIVKCCGWDEK